MAEKPDIRGTSPAPRPRPSKSILAGVKEWLQGQRGGAERAFIEAIVEAIEPKIKQVHGYRKRLQIPLSVCQEHSKKIVAGIPGPIYLKHPGDYTDPLINAAFVGPEKLEDLIAKTESLRLETGGLSGPERVALLTMARTDRTIFGRSLHDALLVSDERLTSITFSDHKIVAMAESFEESRKQLEKHILGIIAHSASHELAVRRTDLEEARQRREKLRAMWELFGGANHADGIPTTGRADEKENLEKVASMLDETEAELSVAIKGFETPEDLLNFLERYLSEPEKIIAVTPVTLRLDWRNVLTENPEEKASTISLAQCSFAEGATRDAVFIAYTKECADRADSPPASSPAPA